MSVKVVLLSGLEVAEGALVGAVVGVHPYLVTAHVIPPVGLVATRVALQDGLGRVQPYTMQQQQPWAIAYTRFALGISI